MAVNVLSGYFSRPIRIVDAHIHFWSQNDVPLILGEVRRLGIEKVCASSLADWDWSAAEDPHAGNSMVFAAADGNPEVLGYVYVDPRYRQQALDEIDRFIGHPAMIGIKLWISCPANDPVIHPLVEVAAEEGLAVLVHAWRRGTRLSRGYQTLPCQVAELASCFPDVAFIMAHVGGDWEQGAWEVADQKNVCVDTCGSINEAGMVETAVEALGARRVLYGSDAPGSGFLSNLGKIVSARITEEEKELVLSGNMDRLLQGLHRPAKDGGSASVVLARDRGSGAVAGLGRKGRDLD